MSEPTTVSDAPLTVTAERTRQFESAVTELARMLRLDSAQAARIGKALGRRFSLVANENGLLLRSGEADAAASLQLDWSLVGPLRAESISGRPFDEELAAETSVCLLSGHGIGGGALEHPVLTIPVTVDGASVELRMTVKCDWDIAERLEAHRP
jgi:hypothetical protein